MVAVNRLGHPQPPSVGILGVGLHLPGAPVGNETILARTGGTAEWVRDRIGIEFRHLAASETTADLATRAAATAVGRSPVRPDMVVVATVTPEQPVPAVACAVQDRLGLHGAPAVDVNAACSGFVYAMVLAWGAVATGAVETPLVVGADVFTRHVDPADRRTAPLFGDGAGAVVLGPVPEGFGILAAELWADGSQRELAYVPAAGAGSENPWFHMDGRGVRDLVLEMGAKALLEVVQRAGIRVEDLDRVIVHQANPRLVGAVADAIGLERSVVPAYGVRTGNTASASIPVSLALAHAERPFARGDHVAMVAVGAGMTAGALVLRWY